jgi:hypothetical protein
MRRDVVKTLLGLQDLTQSIVQKELFSFPEYLALLSDSRTDFERLRRSISDLGPHYKLHTQGTPWRVREPTPNN